MRSKQRKVEYIDMRLGITRVKQRQDIVCGRYTEYCQTRSVSILVTFPVQRTRISRSNDAAWIALRHASLRGTETGHVDIFPEKMSTLLRGNIKPSSEGLCCAVQSIWPRTFTTWCLSPNYLIALRIILLSAARNRRLRGGSFSLFKASLPQS